MHQHDLIERLPCRRRRWVPS